MNSGQVLEGTWEEILSRSTELAGHRVRVAVLDEPKPPRSAEERQHAMLEWINELKRTPLTAEEKDILDGFREFRRQHPFGMRTLCDDT